MGSEFNSTRRTVTYNEAFEAELIEAYPAATSVPEAIVMAAQEGVWWRTVGYDLDARVREIVCDELG